VGLFAATIADVAFAAASITGRDLRIDRLSSEAPRISVVRTHCWSEVADSMKFALESAARAAEADGASVEVRELPAIFEDAFRSHSVIQAYEAYRVLAFEYDHHREQLSPVLRGFLNDASAITPEAHQEALTRAMLARNALSDFLRESDVMLTPAAPGAAPKGLGSTGNSTFNRLWTLMGTPCVNVPGLEDDAGLPLGVQIVGRFGCDHQALRAAHFLESAIDRARG
jgi:Asp-tRNA(Asn)/Glu-tRNA(Gln) amidotransferase A subunit family amidase